ncbi:ABC transporter permease [Streptomyces sp. NPDC020875]|uniref:ABC transporter permease n=1 Tax=Streptomyces sp. NPDC020875 TaxID=3154898 RepID=UPI00340661D3
MSGREASFASAASAEWLKLRTLRSTWWTLAAAALLTTGVALLYGGTVGRNAAEFRGPDFDPVLFGFAGVSISQLTVVFLGVAVVGGEHATGQIRASLTAVPDRTVFWFAKLSVLAAVLVAVALPTAFAAFFTAQGAMGEELNVSIGDPGAFRAVLGLAVHLTLLGLVSAGVAGVLRRPVVALSVLVPLFFIVGELLASLPGVGSVARYLPHIAGTRLMSTVADERIPYGPGAGLLILLGWTAAAVAAGLVVLRRRDA